MHLENFQGGRLYHVNGVVVPVNDCFLSYVEMKDLPVRLLPVAPCLLHMTPCEETASVLFSGIF